MDNLTILTNKIQLSFLQRAYTVATFLDISNAFNNVIPSILLQDLKKLGIPACTYKFIENLLCERHIRFVWNGELSSSFTTHKGTPQDFILNLILFNIYLRELGRSLYEETEFPQYADDIVIFSRN